MNFIQFFVLAFICTDLGNSLESSEDSIVEGFFPCDDNREIELTSYCDKEIDCVDKSDERHCDYDACSLSTSEQFVCTSGQQCVLSSFRCDGVYDCTDKSDELGCERAQKLVCPEGVFMCANGEGCKADVYRCNNQQDCSDNSDEENCESLLRGFSECRDRFKCGRGGLCLKDNSFICDGKKQCPDGSDESERICKSQSVKCEHCQGSCVPHAEGAICTCQNGFELAEDGHSCRDIDECAKSICSHDCVNTEGSFECRCRSGYILLNGTSCKRPEKPTFVWYRGHGASDCEIVFSQADRVRKHKIYFTPSATESALQIHKPPMDFDIENEMLYMLLDTSLFVFDLKVQLIERRQVFPPHVHMVDFAVDHVTRNVYFTTPNRKSIKVCHIEGSCIPLVPGNSEVISRLQIASLATGMKLFWEQGSKIMSGSTDGVERQIIHRVMGEVLRDFVVDEENSKLYALQSNLVEIDLPTKAIRTLAKLNLGLSHEPHWKIAVIDDSIYMQKLDWKSLETDSSMSSDSYELYELSRLTGDRLDQKKVPLRSQLHSVQRASPRKLLNPCWNPRTCSHICVASSSETVRPKCLCPPGMHLDDETRSHCIVDEGQEQIFFVRGDRFSTYVYADDMLYLNEEIKLNVRPLAIATNLQMDLIYSTNDGLFVLAKNGTRSECGSRLRNILSMVFDPVDDVLYAVNGEDLMLINLRTSAVGLIKEANYIRHIDIDPSSRTLYLELANSTLYSMAIGDWTSMFLTDLPRSSRKGRKGWIFDPFNYEIRVNVSVVLKNGYCGFVYANDPGFDCQAHAGRFSNRDYYGNYLLIGSRPSSRISHDTACEGTRCTICVTTASHEPICVCPYGHEVDADGKTCSEKCPPDMVRCSAEGNKCIHQSARCGDVPDNCSDGSNGKNCREDECARGSNCDSSLAVSGSAWQNKICDPRKNFCCDDERTLDLAVRCNGIADCADSSDERKCPDRTCKPPNFRCDDGVCLSESSVCNGIPQCDNGADEENCRGQCASKNLFECVAEGRCLAQTTVCDGTNHCIDGSDEAEENCPFLWSGNTTDHETACFADGFRCLNGQCIHLGQFCDGKPHCSDGSDEGDHCVHYDCKNANCSQGCLNKYFGVQCTCDVGYRLLDDGHTCQDIDECSESPEVCSHFCMNLEGSYSCSCASGFVKSGTGECHVESGDPIILGIENGVVEAIYKDKRKLLLFESHDSEIGGIEYDAVTGLVFVSDTSNNKVHRIPVNLSHISYSHEVYTQLKPGVLALDWITENLYFADFRPSIHVCNRFMAGAYCTMLTTVKTKPIPDLPTPSITSMALVPDAGIMFYSENLSGFIFRQNMDGSNKTTFGWGFREKRPLSLTVDHIHRTLYWLNAYTGSIEISDFEGGSKRTLPGHFNFVKTFAIFEDFLFIPEPKLEHWVIMHKRTGRIRSSKFSPLGRLTAIKVLHKVNQPHQANRCKNRCQQMCLLKPDSFTCACKDGQELSEDKKSCVDVILDGEQLQDAAWLERLVQECSCENGGKCLASKMMNRQFYCKCPPGYHGERCESGPSGGLLLSVVLVCVFFILVAAIGVFLIILAARHDRVRRELGPPADELSDKRNLIIESGLDNADDDQHVYVAA